MRRNAFEREQGLPEQDWSEQAYNRVRDAKVLNGPHVLREVLHGMGFELK
jgi:hypothetical protein